MNIKLIATLLSSMFFILFSTAKADTCPLAGTIVKDGNIRCPSPWQCQILPAGTTIDPTWSWAFSNVEINPVYPAEPGNIRCTYVAIKGFYLDINILLIQPSPPTYKPSSGEWSNNYGQLSCKGSEISCVFEPASSNKAP